jgi:hypothetical protein
MRLLLIGTIGDSKFVSNLGSEVEIKVLNIKNNRVLFEVVSSKTAVHTIDDLVFLKKQAD